MKDLNIYVGEKAVSSTNCAEDLNYIPISHPVQKRMDFKMDRRSICNTLNLETTQEKQGKHLRI
jgi:hypothetical protein